MQKAQPKQNHQGEPPSIPKPRFDPLSNGKSRPVTAEKIIFHCQKVDFVSFQLHPWFLVNSVNQIPKKGEQEQERGKFQKINKTYLMPKVNGGVLRDDDIRQVLNLYSCPEIWEMKLKQK